MDNQEKFFGFVRIGSLAKNVFWTSCLINIKDMFFDFIMHLFARTMSKDAEFNRHVVKRSDTDPNCAIFAKTQNLKKT